jgi:hypothetical protein
MVSAADSVPGTGHGGSAAAGGATTSIAAVHPTPIAGNAFTPTTRGYEWTLACRAGLQRGARFLRLVPDTGVDTLRGTEHTAARRIRHAVLVQAVRQRSVLGRRRYGGTRRGRGSRHSARAARRGTDRRGLRGSRGRNATGEECGGRRGDPEVKAAHQPTYRVSRADRWGTKPPSASTRSST